MKKLIKKVIATTVAVVSLCTMSSSLMASADEISLASTNPYGIGTYIPVLDINNDGSVDLLDQILLNKYLAGSVSFTAIQKRAADVNADGVVNQLDADMLTDFLVHLIDSVPNGPYIIGDANLDGTVNMDDVNKIISYIMNNSGLTIVQQRAADINDDGTVNMDDLSALTNYLS